MIELDQILRISAEQRQSEMDPVQDNRATSVGAISVVIMQIQIPRSSVTLSTYESGEIVDSHMTTEQDDEFEALCAGPPALNVDLGKTG